MGSGLTKRKSTPSQEHSHKSLSQEFRPSKPIGKAITEETGANGGQFQQAQSTYSSQSTAVDLAVQPDVDASGLTQRAEELQSAELHPVVNKNIDSQETYVEKPRVVKGSSRSDTQVFLNQRSTGTSDYPTWQDWAKNLPPVLTQPASLSALTSELYKRRPQFEFLDFDKGNLPGQQKWGQACTESLRNALLPSQFSNKNVQLSRSLPTSIERMEPLRTTTLLPVKSKDPSRTDRRNSILSNLNCVLDVIPENVDDEKDDPDDYEYSEMDLYF